MILIIKQVLKTAAPNTVQQVKWVHQPHDACHIVSFMGFDSSYFMLWYNAKNKGLFDSMTSQPLNKLVYQHAQKVVAEF